MNSFIDSQIWGSADSLQKQIDDRICAKTNKCISYKQTQDSSAHVHAMLTMALMDTIDKSNFLIFIKSENSLRPFEPDVTTLHGYLRKSLLPIISDAPFVKRYVSLRQVELTKADRISFMRLGLKIIQCLHTGGSVRWKVLENHQMFITTFWDYGKSIIKFHVYI